MKTLRETLSAETSNQWHTTLAQARYDFSLHHLIERQAARAPNATAVIHNNATLTYGELNTKANKLAHELIQLGVTKNSLVGICIDRSIEMVVGLLGILKSGGAYVPFDPDYPISRLVFMATDSCISIMVTESKYESLIPDLTIHALLLGNSTETFSRQPGTNPTINSRPTDLAYMIYTSGSTGKPKGAMISHRAIINRLIWMQVEYNISESDRILQKTPMSFDVSVWEFFWPLIVGAKLVMANAGGHKDPQYLIDIIEKQNITVLHFVPSMLSLFLSTPGLNRITSLKEVFCSGEALPHELTKRFFNAMHARLHNLYGPTEAAVDVTYWECKPGDISTLVPIGKPISNIQMYCLDENLNPVAGGEEGELHIGGIGLSDGYWKRPTLTEEKFIDNPFSTEANAKLYKTGDLGRFLPDGNIEYLGRIDFQVKIRGLRIELGEIEAELLKHEAIRTATVIPSNDSLGEKRLLSYLVVDKQKKFSIPELRQFLASRLPDYMIPAAFILIENMPLMPNGKTDRKALPQGTISRPDLNQPYIAPGTKLEKILCSIWKNLLNMDKVGVDDNFFDIGGNSLLSMMVVTELNDQENITLPLVKLFQHPTVRSLALRLEGSADNNIEIDKIFERSASLKQTLSAKKRGENEIAIIGMSGRFPGAYNTDELWENLCAGKETVTFFTKEQLGPGLDPSLTDDKNYVFARGIIPDGDKFDAAFFGINPTEAKTIDPQQRVFLELAWAALENSGYTSEKFDGLIGVYAGIGNNHYYPLNVMQHTDIVKMVGPFSVMVGNEKDHIATRVANKLNLTGPAVSVHTACSTAMTAIDNACFSLTTGQTDMALAGGISLQTPQYSGQLFEEGGVFSPDGHCRPFDAEAAGTLFSDSAGIVVLKRLNDALRDGDTIYASIKSTALNNDGANKISYLAPSIEGQKKVIAMALARAGVSPSEISYIETHGTGTPIGDPIEVEALTQIYRRDTEAKQFCGLGSIKSNLGHPTIAAGAAAVIKVALSLKHEKIPATLHYTKANPKIDFKNSPFYVVDKLLEWPRAKYKRLAAASSFGFGGTNGHAILEEAPNTQDSGPSRPEQLLMLSAKTEEALNQSCVNLATFLEKHPETKIADIAFTLHNGRADFNHRQFLVGPTNEALISRLKQPGKINRHLLQAKAPELVFVFPGQGSHYVNMGLNFYQEESVFRETVNHCAEILTPHLHCDLRTVLYPEDRDTAKARTKLTDTRYQQPALFTIEYALAKLWNSWGVYPDMMVGHSIGEYVCAVLSGVFTLEDGLHIVSERARLMSEQQEGGMLSVRLPAAELEQHLFPGICLAASNGPALSVASGPHELIDKLKKTLQENNIDSTALHVSRAFHSTMMEPASQPLCELISSAQRNPPKIPFVSTATGNWITKDEITDPLYWGRQLCSPVRFCEAIGKIWEQPKRLLLEVGPRSVATTMAKQQITIPGEKTAIPSLADTEKDNREWQAILQAMGQLWLKGISIDRPAFWGSQQRKRIPLPTYPFARKRYWLEPLYNIYTRANEEVSNQKPITAHANIESTDSPSITIPLSVDKKLIHILEEISGVEFGDDMDQSLSFSELGLDSLFLTQIAFKLKSDFNVGLSFKQLASEYSSIEKLCERIERNQSESVEENKSLTDPTNANPKPTNIEGIPTSSFQREIFELIGRYGYSASCSFNESITINLKGETFSIDNMEYALNQLVLRHDALRMSYTEFGDRLRTTTPMPQPLAQHDLSRLPDGDKAERLRQVQKTEFSQEFNLHRAPLLRATAIKLSEGDYKLIMTTHLAICDGWSLDVLVKDLGALYSAEVTGERPQLAESKSFQKYLEEQTSSASASSRSYWKERFRESIEAIVYPQRTNTIQHRTFNGTRKDLCLNKEIAESLNKKAAQLNCSYYTLLLAGLKLLVYGLTGQRKLVIGMPTAGQAITHQRDLVGNCLHYMPILSQLDPGLALNDFSNSLKNAITEAVDNFDLPFQHLTSEKLETTEPFIQICMNYSPKMDVEQFPFHNIEASYDISPRHFESFDIFINAVVSRNNDTVLEFQHNSDIFSLEEISQWQFLLRGIYEKIANEENTVTLGEILRKQGIVLPDIQPNPKSGGYQEKKQKPGTSPIYFGNNNELYGICHTPKEIISDTGVLFCYPIGQEYMKSHWAFRLLANQLIAKGIPVFKFDYYGTGDSLGGQEDWNVDRWAKDISRAAEQLRIMSGLSKISIVSLRFGSVLAAKAIDNGLAVETLVLWNPVICGSKYLTSLKKMNQKALIEEKRTYPYPSDEQLGADNNEILGFYYTEEIQKEIESSQLMNAIFQYCRNIAITSSHDDDEFLFFLSSLKSRFPTAEYHLLKENVDWYDFQQFQNAILPSEMILKISSLIEGVTT
ncbi:hybrid non-ribosomal peptide synthetase/type I polyketide synthase [Teredinibacter haidensis]|uniref:hybrid non-ribosomal peptide synthetase/type I polyketide synthase n=1 Tax=Teredinibacter haidensis TaxID=2731755 RepID=UPI00094896F6|nr:hybrid non-ribosomal peptide synthetase/type I polyketide synthase [Teredinibacter haidensis]